jgi:hypothetical protein
VKRISEKSGGVMPEETQGQQEQDNQPNEPEGKYNPDSLEDARKIINALEKRVAERDEKLNGYQDQVKSVQERLAAMEAAQRQQLEKSGNFEELARQRASEIENLKPLAEKAQTLEGIIRESNEARVQQIPEAMRGLIPTDYSPAQLQGWLNANQKLLTQTPPPSFDAGAGVDSPAASRLSPEQKAMAKRFGLSDEEMLKQIQKREGRE